ncbi:hypothetical protein [Pseudoxanthomonas koreensis]|uniref:hypothetical protein n=1 Tax=Pseudoxanthomonas koreensis TaxID=266061 RepID=UPI001390F0D5|nr:hypothetical protein [Pseudoxanthomonas koreensis]
MPFAESNPAATLTFDAAVHRALARRLADTPHPHNRADAQEPVRATEAAATEAVPETAR